MSDLSKPILLRQTMNQHNDNKEQILYPQNDFQQFGSPLKNNDFVFDSPMRVSNDSNSHFTSPLRNQMFSPERQQFTNDDPNQPRYNRPSYNVSNQNNLLQNNLLPNNLLPFCDPESADFNSGIQVDEMQTNEMQVNGMHVEGQGNQYNSNQYNSGQFNPNQYNPNQYNSGQYNPNQFNPNQYNSNQYNSSQFASPGHLILIGQTNLENDLNSGLSSGLASQSIEVEQKVTNGSNESNSSTSGVKRRRDVLLDKASEYQNRPLVKPELLTNFPILESQILKQVMHYKIKVTDVPTVKPVYEIKCPFIVYVDKVVRHPLRITSSTKAKASELQQQFFHHILEPSATEQHNQTLTTQTSKLNDIDPEQNCNTYVLQNGAGEKVKYRFLPQESKLVYRLFFAVTDLSANEESKFTKKILSTNSVFFLGAVTKNETDLTKSRYNPSVNHLPLFLNPLLCINQAGNCSLCVNLAEVGQKCFTEAEMQDLLCYYLATEWEQKRKYLHETISSAVTTYAGCARTPLNRETNSSQQSQTEQKSQHATNQSEQKSDQNSNKMERERKEKSILFDSTVAFNVKTYAKFHDATMQEFFCNPTVSQKSLCTPCEVLTPLRKGGQTFKHNSESPLRQQLKMRVLQIQQRKRMNDAQFGQLFQNWWCEEHLHKFTENECYNVEGIYYSNASKPLKSKKTDSKDKTESNKTHTNSNKDKTSPKGKRSATKKSKTS